MAVTTSITVDEFTRRCTRASEQRSVLLEVNAFALKELRALCILAGWPEPISEYGNGRITVLDSDGKIIMEGEPEQIFAELIWP